MSRKTPTFGQVLEYISRGACPQALPILHNLETLAPGLETIEREFSENARFLPPRKNGVALYHEVLSFSVHDRNRITSEVLETLTREYLRLRAPAALGYARAHTDKEAAHVHVLLSANLIASPKRLRLSRGEFEQIKREVEAFQREHFPELANSLVLEGRGREVREKRRLTRAEAEHRRRTNEPSEKERTAEIVRRCLLAAMSEQDFTQKLRAAGLAFYLRGQTAGVRDAATGRKHRLNTLGLAGEVKRCRAVWRELPERERALREIEQERKGRGQEIEREH